MYSVSAEYLAAYRKSVRKTKITGGIKLSDGTIIPIDDSKIIQGKFSISKKICGSSFDIGTCDTSEMDISLYDEQAYSNNYAGALIKLTYSICTDFDNDTWESVPLGAYWVDGKQVSRKRNIVTLTAYDRLGQLDVVFPEDTPTTLGLYGALEYICGYGANMGLAISEEEFNALPNSGITPDFSSSQIQSCRDAVMWIAQTVGCSAFVDYRGLLMLKPYKHVRMNYDRRVYAEERTSIEYSDTFTYIAYLSAYCDGKIKNYENVSAFTGVESSFVRTGALSLPSNPIVASLTAEEQDAINNNLISKTYRSFPTRYVKYQGFIDPALELLDELLFRGGSIDTVGLYGVITEITWKYRGIGTVICNNVEEYEGDEDDTQPVAVSLNDEDGGISALSETTLPSSIAVKSQLEKEIDALRAQSGSGGVGKAVENDPTSEYFNDYDGNKITTYGAGYHHVEGKGNKCGPGSACHVGGMGNSAQYGTALHVDGWNNTLDSGVASSVGGENNVVKNLTAARVDGNGNTVEILSESYITGKNNNIKNCYSSVVCGERNVAESIYQSLIAGEDNTIKYGDHVLVQGEKNEVNSYVGAVIGDSNTVTPGNAGECCYVFGKKNIVKCGSAFAFGLGLLVETLNRCRMVLGEYNINRSSSVDQRSVPLLIGNGSSAQNRSNCFMIDSDGNVYCNHVYETGTSNIEDYFTGNSAPAAKAARAVTAAASAGIPIVLLDHAPTADDLTGSPCVFLQCEGAAVVEGETTGIFRVTDIFAEK